MAEIKRSTLFGKLNSIGYKAIEGATIFCKMRGNPFVETVHWLHQLLQVPDSDIHHLLRHFQIDSSRLAADLITALDRLPRGATSISDFAADIPSVIERAWVYGTLMFGDSQVRTGHLIVGFLNSDLRHKFLAISKELAKIKSLLKKLDVPKRMVQLDVLLVEKKLRNRKEVGINLLEFECRRRSRRNQRRSAARRNG